MTREYSGEGMQSIWDVPFVVVDVETSGANKKNNRITDIACITVIGGKVVSEYSSLVNPHQLIPEFISNMTGITNKMAMEAPEPETVFPKVLEELSLKNAVFVAHNVQFDWGFVTETFNRLGYDIPEMERLCTIKLSRRLISKDVKKNLASLSDYFNIRINGRHRAYGDAFATAKVLVRLLEMAEQEHDIYDIDELLKFHRKASKYSAVPKRVLNRVKPFLETLPASPGVYYFYDRYGGLLYIGKAKCLKDRVKSYFRPGSLNNSKIREMLKRIFTVKWEETGSELAALLMESREIKKHKPPFNTVDKKYRRFPLLKLTLNEDFPRLKKCYEINDDGAEYFGPFRSSELVDEIIKNVDKNFRLCKCDKTFIPSPDNKPCFYYQLKKCYSPCSEGISIDNYKNEAEKVRYYLNGFSDGIIRQFEMKMNIFADNYEYEKAEMVKRQVYELKRLLSRNEIIPASINSNNFILILPVSEREKILEIYIIRKGKLLFQDTVGRRSPLARLRSIIRSSFFSGNGLPFIHTPEDLDELRIITSWSYQKRERGIFIYTEGKEEEELIDEFTHQVRNSYP